MRVSPEVVPLPAVDPVCFSSLTACFCRAFLESHPNVSCRRRFDSWAGMALARASRIQEKLNSNELKSDVPIWKHSQAVLNCFKRALEIDGSNLSLWIEYGTISYALHTFASRQLKQWRSELPPEVVKQVGGGSPGFHSLCLHVRLP